MANKSLIESTSSEQTEAYATQFGSLLQGGEIIELIGDVGAGKTTFVRGLAKGAGSKDRVSSPTFTVTNLYNASDITLHHYDFYRLQDVAIMQSEIQEVQDDPKAVIIMEWAESISEVIPAEHIKISFSPKSETTRILSLEIPQASSYLEL